MAIGGVDGLLEGLGTDFKKGLDRDVLASTSTGSSAATANAEERKRVYGANTIPVRPVKSLFYLMYLALKDKVLIILCIAAVVSLALGLYSALGTEPKMAPNAQGIPVPEPQVDWVEGLAIMVAVVSESIASPPYSPSQSPDACFDPQSSFSSDPSMTGRRRSSFRSSTLKKRIARSKSFAQVMRRLSVFT